MEWFQIVAAIGAACLFIAWLADKFPNQVGGDRAGAARITGFFGLVAIAAFVLSAIGWAFS